jgi:hypothetical protein
MMKGLSLNAYCTLSCVSLVLAMAVPSFAQRTPLDPMTVALPRLYGYNHHCSRMRWIIGRSWWLLAPVDQKVRLGSRTGWYPRYRRR